MSDVLILVINYLYAKFLSFLHEEVININSPSQTFAFILFKSSINFVGSGVGGTKVILSVEFQKFLLKINT